MRLLCRLSIVTVLILPSAVVHAQQLNYSFFNDGNRDGCKCTPDQELCTLKYCSLVHVGNQCQRSCNNTNALGPPTSVTIFPSDPSRQIQEFSVVPKGQ